MALSCRRIGPANRVSLDTLSLSLSLRNLSSLETDIRSVIDRGTYELLRIDFNETS